MIASIVQSLASLENKLGLMVTIHDSWGIFHDQGGRSLLDFQRQSHRRNPLCFTAERSTCTDYCNTEINVRSFSEDKDWFLSKCCFGLYEVIVPVRHNGQLMFIIFAGMWRDEANTKAVGYYKRLKGLEQRYLDLPVYSKEEEVAIGGIVSTFGKGLMSIIEEAQTRGLNTGSRKDQINCFIHSNSHKSITTTDLAQSLHVSPTRAGHIVRELFGESFTKLILHERLLRAKAKLSSTDRSISEIATMTGFGNEFHFSRIFKREVGMPPSKYRKNHIESYHQET